MVFLLPRAVPSFAFLRSISKTVSPTWTNRIHALASAARRGSFHRWETNMSNPELARKDDAHTSTLRLSPGHDAANENAASEQSARLRRVATVVADFASGANIIDDSGNSVDRVYFKRDSYAIYRSDEEVLVVYSDNEDIASKQIAAISGLLPLRDQLANIIREIREANLRERYLAQIADALLVGLEGQVDTGKDLIKGAVNDAKENLMRAGRLVYLEWAAGMALTAAMTIAAILMVGGIADVQDRAHVHLVLLATGAGAIGVLLSIAIAIRGRTIVIDGNRQTNIIDAALRVLIGAISAAVLFLLLDSGALADIQIGAAKIAGKSPSWQATLLVGFAAGFFERLVPDLLEKAGPPQGPITTPAPAPAPTSG